MGAEVNRANKEGATPLHVTSESGSREVVELLIENGADINAVDNAGVHLYTLHLFMILVQE